MAITMPYAVAVFSIIVQSLTIRSVILRIIPSILLAQGAKGNVALSNNSPHSPATSCIPEWRPI